MWHWTQGNQQRTSDSKKLLSTSMPCIISSWFRLSTVLYDDGLLFYYRILDYRSSYCLILPSGCLRFLMTPILSNKLRHTYREFPINFNSITIELKCRSLSCVYVDQTCHLISQYAVIDELNKATPNFAAEFYATNSSMN